MPNCAVYSQGSHDRLCTMVTRSHCDTVRIEQRTKIVVMYAINVEGEDAGAVFCVPVKCEPINF